MSDPKITRIVIAYDGSKESERAAKLAIELAKKLGAELFLLNIVSRREEFLGIARHVVPIRLDEEETDENRKRLDDSIKKIMELGRNEGVEIASETKNSGPDVASTIVDYAVAQNADLIVAGTRGLNPYESSLAQSVSSDLVSKSRCSVLIAR